MGFTTSLLWVREFDVLRSLQNQKIPSSPCSYSIAGSNSELGMGGRGKLAIELKLLCFVTDQLFPFVPALVPLQLVLGDGGAIVLRGVPTQGERALGPTGDLRREGRWWGESGNGEGRFCSNYTNTMNNNYYTLSSDRRVKGRLILFYNAGWQVLRIIKNMATMEPPIKDLPKRR